MLISFLFLNKNMCCGYSLKALWWGTSNEYPQCMFSSRNKKNIMWIPPLICSYEYPHNTFWSRSKKNFNIFWLKTKILSGAMISDTIIPYHNYTIIWTATWTIWMMCLKIAEWMNNSADPNQTGSSCSKLTMLLLNISLNLWSLNMAYMLLFLLKKCE